MLSYNSKISVVITSILMKLYGRHMLLIFSLFLVVVIYYIVTHVVLIAYNLEMFRVLFYN